MNLIGDLGGKMRGGLRDGWSVSGLECVEIHLSIGSTVELTR